MTEISLTFETTLMMAERARQANDAANRALKMVPGIGSGPMGLTPKHVKESPEFIKAKKDFDDTWHVMRHWNAMLTRHFKPEYNAFIRAKRAAREALVTTNEVLVVNPGKFPVLRTQFPPFLRAIFMKTFTVEEYEVLECNWDRYIQMSYSNSSEEEFIDAAKRVLFLSK